MRCLASREALIPGREENNTGGSPKRIIPHHSKYKQDVLSIDSTQLSHPTRGTVLEA